MVQCSVFIIAPTVLLNFSIGIKFNYTLFSYFKNPDVATNIPNHLM